jgi:hypothetical protein
VEDKSTRSARLYRCTILALALTIPLLGRAAPAEPTPQVPMLDHGTVEARGTRSALLTVNAFGRYAVTAASSQGVALQAVDRMAGAGEVKGEAGTEDGRLDLFLDRGQYKILTHAADNGKGKVTLEAHAFHELQQRAPLLVEHRLEQASLGDFEQRSYWIEIKEKRMVALEAAGRYLADLRLWRDGTWLVDAAPQMVQGQGRAEQPLRIARLSTQLTPGLYLLTAYGGPGTSWTQASSAKPFLLRFGIPTLAPAMRQQFTMSEFGTDRFLVPNGPNYFRLELPLAVPASLQVGGFAEGSPFTAQGDSATIDKRSLPPVAELENVSGEGMKVVTVSMEAGKSFILQHFEARNSARFDAAGEHWVSSIHAGPTDDAVGATGVLTREPRHAKEEYLGEQVLDLAATPNWRRRFNLLDELTIFVKVESTSKVRVQGTGVAAHYRFEPFLLSRPKDYKTPPWQESGFVFDLDSGLHVLTIAPQTKGILDLHLSAPDAAPAEALSPASPGVRFSPLVLERDTHYTLYLNHQPGVAAGLVLRPLPVDLTQSLPVSQRAGETLTIPVHVPERATVQALTDDGRLLDIAIENGKTGTAVDVEAGNYKVIIKGSSQTQRFSLIAQPLRLASRTPLPSMPDARLAGLPKFPVITPDEPRFVDLGRRSTTIEQVAVEKAGLYQFESTGLLQTKGIVRTRLNPSLFDAAENGTGRNFLIQRYLREGDYQLSVSTQGATHGNLGVQVARTEIVDGGALREGQVARALLPSAQAIAYRFRIAQSGSYHLQTLGLGRNFDIRLEDDAGWPVGAPVQTGDLTVQLEPGSYRLLVLPQTAPARVLTRLDRLSEPVSYSGHGPHRIALDTPVEHTWIEPDKGAARTPDQWEFVLPAAADVTISLDNEMQAQVLKAGDPKRSVLANVGPQHAWLGPLPAGRYVVQAVNSRSNSHVGYTLRVAPTQLVAGLARTVQAPATLPVSVGTDGMIELQSFGGADVRARLIDRDGAVVAQNDDRTDDWNFLIAQRLRPGQYTLQIDPVSQAQAQTTVSMDAPVEVLEKPLQAGSQIEFTDANVHIYPLVTPSTRNVLLVSAQSSDAVGLALEGEASAGWVNLGGTSMKQPYLVLPLPAVAARFKAYRLRAWSVDRRSLRVNVRSTTATLPALTESQWTQGAGTTRVDEVVPRLRLAMVELSHPGAFRLKGELSTLRWTDSGARTAQATNNSVISVSGKTVWLATEEAQGTTLLAQRLQVPSGDQEPLRLELMAGQTGLVDLAPAAGPSLVIAQSRVGQPGIALGSQRDPHAMGLVPGEVVAVAFPGATTAASVWNASNQGASLELDVHQVTLRQAVPQFLLAGASDGSIIARVALPIKLAGSMQRVHLTLPPLMAAVFQKRGAIVSTHWGGADAMHESVLTDADQLWLLNTDGATAHYVVEIAPAAGEAEPPLKPNELLERVQSAAGRLRVPVEVPASASTATVDQYTLRVRGNARALWLENGGRIVSGNDIVIRGSGVLTLDHQPGTLVAWLDAPRAQGVHRVSDWFKAFQETTVKPPQTVALHGKQQVLNMKFDFPTMLHVRTSVPVVAQFAIEGQPPRTEVHLNGANINLVAPGGPSRLLLRAVGADSLSGAANVLTTPILHLVEGVGPPLLLAPGSARLFSFDLKQQQTIGIGVRASSDVINSVLYDAHGVQVSEGVVQMPTLAPGRYYLSVDMPAGSAPVQVQPIVLGISKPDTRPPLDILRRYVENKGDGEPLLFVPPAPDTPAEPQEDSPQEDKPAEGTEPEQPAPSADQG